MSSKPLLYPAVCPNCETKVELKREHLGIPLDCLTCGHTFKYDEPLRIEKEEAIRKTIEERLKAKEDANHRKQEQRLTKQARTPKTKWWNNSQFVTAWKSGSDNLGQSKLLRMAAVFIVSPMIFIWVTSFISRGWFFGILDGLCGCFICIGVLILIASIAVQILAVVNTKIKRKIVLLHDPENKNGIISDSNAIAAMSFASLPTQFPAWANGLMYALIGVAFCAVIALTCSYPLVSWLVDPKENDVNVFLDWWMIGSLYALPECTAGVAVLGFVIGYSRKPRKEPLTAREIRDRRAIIISAIVLIILAVPMVSQWPSRYQSSAEHLGKCVDKYVRNAGRCMDSKDSDENWEYYSLFNAVDVAYKNFLRQCSGKEKQRDSYNQLSKAADLILKAESELGSRIKLMFSEEPKQKWRELVSQADVCNARGLYSLKLGN